VGSSPIASTALSRRTTLSSVVVTAAVQPSHCSGITLPSANDHREALAEGNLPQVQREIPL
jgi:hypothetical protein